MISSVPKHFPKFIHKCIKKGSQNTIFHAIKNLSSENFLWHPRLVRCEDQNRSKMRVQNKMQNLFQNWCPKWGPKWDPKLIENEVQKLRSQFTGNVRDFGIYFWTLLEFFLDNFRDPFLHHFFVFFWIIFVFVLICFAIHFLTLSFTFVSKSFVCAYFFQRVDPSKNAASDASP